jgi:Kef-type K+ transport system membrane component KefB
MNMFDITALIRAPEFQYTALVFFLFIVPRFLVRYGIPTGITSFFLGFLSAIAYAPVSHDPTLSMLAAFGIVSLFLFAGLEVDMKEITSQGKVILGHVIIRCVLLALVAIGLSKVFNLNPRPAIILALAVLTPSTGFILDALDASSADSRRKFWVRSKAIAAELVALGALFLAVQAGSWQQLLFSSVVMVLFIAVLPSLFKGFAKLILPYAPRSEFGFLIMLAVMAGMLTRKLGAYYLVGAFVVGLAAQRFEHELPNMVSKQMLQSIKSFASFFTPFYFFYAGTHVYVSDINMQSILIGVGMVALFVPLRLAEVVFHRRATVKEPSSESVSIAISLLPTLVFGLVLAGILKDRFNVPREVFGSVIIYTVLVTLIPPALKRNKRIKRVLTNETFETAV